MSWMMCGMLLRNQRFLRRFRPVSSCLPLLNATPSRSHIRLLFRFQLLRRSMLQASKVVWARRLCRGKSALEVDFPRGEG